MGKVDARFSPTTSALPLAQITAVHFEQTLLTSIKANYLLIGADLKSNSLMMGSLVNVNLGAGRCDGLAAPTTCTYVRGVAYFSLFMDMTKYKIFLSITGFSFFSDSTTTVTPYTSTGIQSKLQIKYTAFTSTASNVITVQVTVDKASMSFIAFYVIGVHLNMFNASLELGTVLIEFQKKMTAPGTQFGTFPETVFRNNYFMGLNAFKGPRFAYDVFSSNPANLKLSVWLYGGSTNIHVHGFVIYGFTDECQTRRSCRACYVPPNYQCTQCQKNFLPTSPPNSVCKCPRPFTEVSGICDIIQLGCIVATRLPDQSIKCHQCNIAKRLVINNLTNSCECMPKFEMGQNDTCRQICGDGFRVILQCDDNNTIAGDGCSPTCRLERGFMCNTSVEPTTCHSSSPLIYEIESIIKKESSNSAVMRLKLKNEFNYPFGVYKEQFQPVQDFIKLQTVLSFSPYNQIQLTDLELTQVDDQKVIEIIFSFNVTLQNTDAKIHLNYKQTYYQDYIQTLQFKIKGDNKPLKFEDRIPVFENIGSGILIGAMVSMLLLVLGLITPKFIGLETIITLQLIFFSQILIYDNTKFPVGFLFLSNLQYTAGFNQIIDFSQYIPMTDASKKMYSIKREKLIIENFNINFGILFLCFLVLMITCFIRKINEDMVLESRAMEKQQGPEKPIKQKAVPLKFNPKMRKANEITFYISNQVAFWLFLPLVAALSAAMSIENFTLVMKDQNHYLINKGDEIVALGSALMMFGIVLSNYGNMWLSNISMKEVNDRIEQLKYKREFFVYLTITGFYIFFNNDMNSDGIYCSVVVLLIHTFHIVYLYLIDPYKQSLKVHTVGMMFNNFVYFLFLIIINVINYSEDINSDATLALGYTIIFCCFISIVITLVRLYYELKYGKQLEEKLRQERLERQQEQLLRKQLQNKRIKQQIEDQAGARLSQKQKLRDNNAYLYENQVKQDQKKSFMQWLEGRQLLNQKTRDTHYFKHFAQKPLYWLQKNDKDKYEAKIKEISEHRQKGRQKDAQVHADRNYQSIVYRLKRQVHNLKLKQTEKFEKHEKKMKNSTNYAMSIMKEEKQKLFQKSFSLKKR